MDSLWSLLPLLVCPVVMGLVMWLMRRGPAGDGARAGVDAPAPPARPSTGHAAVARDGATGLVGPRALLGRLCLDWRVLAVLAVVGLGVWALVPGLIGAVLPLLLVAACPLSMLLMLRGRAHDRCAARSEPLAPPAAAGHADAAGLVALRAEQVAIVRKIALLEAARGPAQPAAAGIAPGAEHVGRADAGRPPVPDGQPEAASR